MSSSSSLRPSSSALLAHRLVLAADEVGKQVVRRHAADQRAVAVRVDQADGHVHARALGGAAGDQRRAGQHVVEVAHDGRGLEHAQAVVVDHRHLAERMAGQVLGLPRLARQHVQRHLLEVGEALFGEQHLDGAHIGRAVETVEGQGGHGDRLPAWRRERRETSVADRQAPRRNPAAERIATTRDRCAGRIDARATTAAPWLFEPAERLSRCGRSAAAGGSGQFRRSARVEPSSTPPSEMALVRSSADSALWSVGQRIGNGLPMPRIQG